MHLLAGFLGAFLIIAILVEGFETVVQPRRVMRRYRISRLYYATIWSSWRWLANGPLRHAKRRTGFLASFGPLSLLGIFATWVLALISGFALLQWGLDDAIVLTSGSTQVSIGSYFYLSGTTFFTLGYGDITPTGPLGRLLAVAESGLGFGFLAAILSYLPALFQAFSRREVNISLLDARAGSPPSASQLILRAARNDRIAELETFLGTWERWAAELLESQLSFPVLAFYRSQHDNQSWLAALTVVLDTCATIMTQASNINLYQTQVTFAIARHAAVDLAIVLHAKAPGHAELAERLNHEQFLNLHALMQSAGMALRPTSGSEESFRQLRGTYEPFLQGLADRLLLTVPPLVSADNILDNWQRSAWMKPIPGINNIAVAVADEAHFG